MCVRFLKCVFAAVALGSTLAWAGDESFDQDPDCTLPLVSTVNTRRLNVQRFQEFAIGGDGWMRTHRTADGRVVVASVDNFQRLQVYDLNTRETIGLATRQDFDGRYTRGEWAIHDGRSVVILGDTFGRLHFFTIGPDPEYFSIQTGENTPAFPLAITADGGIVVGFPTIGRVRIMPLPPRLTNATARDEHAISTSSRFMRASHFRPTGRRDLIAALSQGTLEVFDREADATNPRWSTNLATDGRDSSVTWFRDAHGEPSVVLADGDKLTIYFPFNPPRQRVEARIAGTAVGRVHALTTPNGITFLEAPGTEGSNIYQFSNGLLSQFTKLEPSVAPGQKSIFLAPNGRVYILWVEELDHSRRRLNISKVQRSTTEPTFQFELERDEYVHDAQAMNLDDNAQLMTLKTSLRTISFKITPAPAS